MVCNFARFSACLTHGPGYDGRRRFARLNWRVGLSTNSLGTVCMAGRAGGKFPDEEMIISLEAEAFYS